jgi:hypothetical protein
MDFEKTCDFFGREVLYSIVIEFGKLMKLIRLIKTYLNETYSKALLGKYLSNGLPIHNGPGTGGCFIAIAFQL